ncbi:MAG TPA: bifunctional nuclease family protein [Candidatus Bathyarchaeia archaeon]|nr:bifunctional nuclease family protein [Candidatus Bathyarchaeia archaeon]
MVPLEVLGVSQADRSGFPFVLLRNESRVLPILVGPHEASAIQIVLMGETPPRPLTHDLICNLLAGLRGQLQSVNIYKLENDIFYAHLNIEQRSPSGQVEQVLRVDSRPSDGIAIAVRMQCPIFAAEEVMDAAAQDASILSSTEEEEDTDQEEPEEGEGGFKP